jgi:hypothetical protein
MSFKLHNKKKYDFECKGMAYFGIAFCYIGRYGGDFFWRSLAQGFWIQQVFACVFLSFLFLANGKA